MINNRSLSNIIQYFNMRNFLFLLWHFNSFYFIYFIFPSSFNPLVKEKEFERCTYRAAALVRLVTEAAPLPASEERRTAGNGWLALAKGAVVLVHDELAMKVALDLGADSFVIQGGDIWRWIMTGAHRAAVLVLDEVAVQSAMRQFRANFVIFR